MIKHLKDGSFYPALQSNLEWHSEKAEIKDISLGLKWFVEFN